MQPKFKIGAFLLTFILFQTFSIAQELNEIEIEGRIVTTKNKKIEPIPYVKVKCSSSEHVSITDEDGHFNIHVHELPDTLLIKAVGYDLMAFAVAEAGQEYEINLKSGTMLTGVVVIGRNLGRHIDLKNPFNVEKIGQDELRKAACCNLSESFETNASVDVNLTDAVSGAKKIQMLGLDGVYTQMQWENIPLIRGLSTSYGLSFTPGTWIESIQITKGTGSVVNGYESIAGMINLEVKKPSESERLYINIYGNKFTRAEINVHGAQRINDKWSTMTFLHASNQFNETDVNKDGFKDMPVGFLGAAMHRWDFKGKNMESRFGIKGTFADKVGGQLGYNSSSDPTFPKWGASFKTSHLEAFSKVGIFMKNRPKGSLGIVNQLKYHKMDNVFGTSTYSGVQKKWYSNFIYSDIIGNTNHNYKTGVSFILDDYNQSYNDSTFLKTEIVPGAFFEYTYKHLENFTLVAGVRGDYHNLYGPLFAPRLHAKWNASKKSALRFSVGRGYRVPNPYSDFNSLMASSRTWIVDPNIVPEDGISSGVTFTQKFLIKDEVSTFTVDYFYTHFRNQLVTDLDVSPNEVHIYNSTGQSFSHAIQAEIALKLSKTFEFRTAFKYYDVKAEFGGELQQKAFVPKYRVLLNAGYKTRNKKWEFDLTANWVGKKRLPSTASNPLEHTRPDESVDYWILNSQISYKLKRMSFYVGAENMLNVIQNNAIISADDPFGSYFDATQIWAPIFGANIYAGLHFDIKHKKK
ncbi:MAG: outer membrane receptor for ferrienterochelin and colicins [Arenicella sp.]|jgi:outer membrane receptor for ferrienterochelin and colicins